MESIRLIQGFFFQPYSFLGLGYDKQGDVASFVHHYKSFAFPFSGMIYATDNPAMFVGEMEDRFGRSVLLDISISQDVLWFIKKYGPENRGQRFRYEFKKEGPIWIGSYNGEGMNGRSKAILTEVPMDMLLP